MDDVIFEDFSVKVINVIDDRVNIVLEECAGELESKVKRVSRKKTGETRGSFQHKVIDSEHTAYIGSNEENAIWEEFGTGEHALKGNGRKGGWWYKNPNATFNKDGTIRKNSKESEFVFTYGKKPSRAFWKAYTSMKNKLIKHIQDSLKGL